LQVEFEQRQLEKSFKSLSTLTRRFGRRAANNLGKRIKELEVADNLSQISHVPPPRLHALTGNRRGYFAVMVTANMRLVFSGLNHEGEKSLVKSEITAVLVKEVVDYHD